MNDTEIVPETNKKSANITVDKILRETGKFVTSPHFVGAIANLTMLVLVLRFETTGAITSKSFGFIRPNRMS